MRFFLFIVNSKGTGGGGVGVIPERSLTISCSVRLYSDHVDSKRRDSVTSHLIRMFLCLNSSL
jgi:hypothetical protein